MSLADYRSRFFTCKPCGITFLYLVLALLTLSSCEKKKKTGDSELTYPLETAKLVSHVTSGVIAPDDPIRVRFVSDVIRKDLVGQSLSENVFVFDPPIDGIARWTDRQTLEYKPNQQLDLRTDFDGELLLSRLLPEHKDQLEPLKFSFSVSGREIASLEADFELVNRDDPKNVIFEGRMSLTVSASLAAAKKALRLQKGNTSYPLDVTEEDNGTAFRFKSKPIRRTSRIQNFQLNIAQADLEISQDLQQKYVLGPETVMLATDVSRSDGSGKSHVVVTFSDELDRKQDLSGLISTEPEVGNLRLTASGKEVTLTGDFQMGSSYQVKVSKGIRSRWGSVSAEGTQVEVQFSDIKPQIKFSSSGAFLPTSNDRQLYFQSVNATKVRLIVKRVFENNLGQFLQTEMVSSGADRNDDFNHSYVNRVGVEVYNKELELGPERNVWKQHVLDLRQLIGEQDRGLYLFAISFQNQDMLYGDPEEMREAQSRYYYGDDYYSNPYSRGYLYQNGRIFKPMIISDLGLTFKKGHKRSLVYVTDLKTTEPLSGVKVTLKSYQNQELSSRATNGQGMAEFPEISDQIFMIEADYKGQRSVIKTNEMAWNLSTFDVDGVQSVPSGTRTFLYTERGVYRPGDRVNFGVIVRNDQGSFPGNHPVDMRIYNPRGQKVFEQTNRSATDGFYHFSFESKQEDPTGNWRVEIVAGSRPSYHELKIETVVPFRLKVRITPEKENLAMTDAVVRASLQGNYLFGNPAAGLRGEVDLRLQERSIAAGEFRNFIFRNSTVEFRPLDANIFKGTLDASGAAQVSWQLPQNTVAPGALRIVLNARVLEKGGRPNTGVASVNLDPYQHYVGIQRPETRYGYARIGNEVQIPAIAINAQGSAVAGRPLQYRIYHARQYWWWEFDSRQEYELRFKKDVAKEIVASGTVISKSLPEMIPFTPEDQGVYLVEVQDGTNGHSAAFFMEAWGWGGAVQGKDAGLLSLRSDKERYLIGDEAVVTFPAPREGRILVSVERGTEILDSRWFDPQGEEEATLRIPVTKEMLPTTYVAVSVIQPHAQTLNDRPIRTYGVIPLNVEDPATRQDIVIEMADELRPDSRFPVKIKTADRKKTQFTIAVVDEGLLDITRFKTPDAWRYFFQKMSLGVKSFDLFADVIAANKGDIFKTFSIGGGLDEEYRKSQLDGDQKKRFKPVSMFEGPVMTDENGEATVEFDMPNYVGSVRVMVISATGQRYGRAEKTVPVKTELMIVPSLPRVVGPGDRFNLPVSVFAMKDGIGPVEVSVSTEGPLSAAQSKQTITFKKSGDQDVFFDILAEQAVGQAKIVISASGGGFSMKQETDLMVRATAPRISESFRHSVDAGNKWTFKIPGDGIEGSNHAGLTISRRPSMNINKRLGWLIRYPYGCIEQTTSAVFPQLMLKTVLNNSRRAKASEREIDRNIESGIRRLRRFQLGSGGFAYWPGSTSVSPWGNNYAGHFMIEAKKQGYDIPNDLINRWLNFQKSQSMSTKDNLFVRVYRVYLLALGGKPEVPAMNLLRENNLKDMSTAQKWMLASAYHLAGQKNTASSLSRGLNTRVVAYNDFGITYGSGLRDLAIILQSVMILGDDDTADKLAEEIGNSLSTDQWYSTQTTAYCLLALGKYLQTLEEGQDGNRMIRGKITLPGGETLDLETEDLLTEVEINEGFGKELTFHLDAGSSVKKVFLTLDWDGIPLKSQRPDEEKNIGIDVEWLNENGMKINPFDLPQGSSFWGRFIVSNPLRRRAIDEMALVQILPAGWEIENTRLSGEARPEWMSSWKIASPEYTDIRDDRIMWFFDMSRYTRKMEFIVKINAVTPGTYATPPTLVEAMYDNHFQALKNWPETNVRAKN